MISTKDAEQWKLQEGQVLSFAIDKHLYSLPVKINSTMAHGVAALPYGLEECRQRKCGMGILTKT